MKKSACRKACDCCPDRRIFHDCSKKREEGSGRPGGCFPETVSGFGQLAPHVPQTQHGPPCGQGSVEQEIVRGETERRRGGEGRSDVVEVRRARELLYVLQGAEVEVAGGLHDHDGKTLDGGLESHCGGVGGPDKGIAGEFFGDGGRGETQPFRAAVEEFAEPLLHGQVGMGFDCDIEAFEQAGLKGFGEELQMGFGLVPEEACDHEKVFGRAGDGGRF